VTSQTTPFAFRAIFGAGTSSSTKIRDFSHYIVKYRLCLITEGPVVSTDLCYYIIKFRVALFPIQIQKSLKNTWILKRLFSQISLS
jgi:hypothetical protein